MCRVREPAFSGFWPETRCLSGTLDRILNKLICVISLGFLNKEIEKADIHVVDNGENPEAPHPREMIDLEVGTFYCEGYIEIQMIIIMNRHDRQTVREI